MENLLIRLFGLRGAVLHGDPTVLDRFLWLKRHLWSGKFRTLDAGCGTGACAMFAATRGNEALGISFDARNTRVAQKRARLLGLEKATFVEGDLRKLDQLFPDAGCFDQIICFECIEHIIDDKRLMRNLSRLLVPGGRLLLTTPNLEYRGLVGEDKTKLSQTEDGGHVRWGYSKEDLAKLCLDVGLKMQSCAGVSGLLSQQLTNLLRLSDRVLPHKVGWLLTFPFRALCKLDPFFTALARYPYLSLAIVAQKPEA